MAKIGISERARVRHRVMLRLYWEWRKGLLTDEEYERERQEAEEYL